MFGTSVYVLIGIMIAIGLFLPGSLAFWWLKTRKEKITTMLLGAAGFFVFALILESLVHVIVLQAFPIIFEKTALYTIYGALMAGLFEETARFLIFKFLLKKRTNRETSISYGIGHGGFEAFIFLAYAGVQYLIYAVLIDQGQLQSMIDAAAQAGTDTSALEALPDQIAALTAGAVAWGCFERVSAMMIHIALSVVVFYGVKKHKISLYFLAILLHALFDVPAALFQKGVITSQPVLEIFFFAFALTTLIAVIKLLYNKDIETKEVAESV